jgi:hypothetical protein
MSSSVGDNSDQTEQRSLKGIDEHQDKKPDPKSYEIEIGTDLNMPFSTPFNGTALGVQKTADEELQEIRRNSGWEVDEGPTVRQLVTMRRMDGQARALYRLLSLPVRAALKSATFIPAKGGTAEADFISKVFTTPPEGGGMSVTFHRVMSQILQGLFDGFAPFEKIFWVPDYGPLKGKITLKKLAYRPSETITFITDRQGHFRGFRQRAVIMGKALDAYIPASNAFYYAAQEEERKFYGISFFQSAFYHYDKKVKLYYIAHVAAQRSAVGTRAGTYPLNANNAQRGEFAKSLSNLSLAQFMLMPENFKVEMLKESGTFDFLGYINHHNSQMSKSVLAAFFDANTGAGANEGSLVSFAAPGDDMFLMMLRAVMDDIATAINHYIIPQLVDFNFEGGKYPVFSWGELTDEQRAAVANSFDKLSIAGQTMNVTPEFMRALEQKQAKEMGLEIDYDAVEKREQEQQQQLAGGFPGMPGGLPGMGMPGASPIAAGPGAPGAPVQPSMVPPNRLTPGAPGTISPVPGQTGMQQAAGRTTTQLSPAQRVEAFQSSLAKLTDEPDRYENLLRLASEMLDETPEEDQEPF